MSAQNKNIFGINQHTFALAKQENQDDTHFIQFNEIDQNE